MIRLRVELDIGQCFYICQFNPQISRRSLKHVLLVAEIYAVVTVVGAASNAVLLVVALRTM